MHINEAEESLPFMLQEQNETANTNQLPIVMEGADRDGVGVGNSRPIKVFDDKKLGIEIPETAHQISTDSWVQVCVVLTTGINSAYILGYSGTIMVPLSWVAGTVGLIVATIFSLYASTLTAKIHEHGGKRHIRYRDLAGYFYGRKGYTLLWTLQYINLFMFNVGYIILGGSALKAAYGLFRDDHVLKLPYCIAVAGFVCFMFAILVPHLSALRVWLGVSTVLTVIYTIVALVYSIKDGVKAPARDYSFQGTTINRIFTTVGAIANLFFPFNTGMIPEIQATIKEPVVGNMLKALYVQFTVGVIPLFAVTLAGYWAYGSSTSTYLLSSTSGPVWLKAIANISAFLQAIIAFHIFASPSYEYLDTKYGIEGSALAIRNLLFRVAVRGGYLVISTLVPAILPFLGDFMSLTGALCTFPVTFIIPNHLYLLAKKNKLTTLQKLWHWLNIWCFGLMSIAAAIAAVRLIVVDSRSYHAFADL
ncbi:hypothetical protein K2173_004895 [Erythroxylum novogranatense]|uniref:Amino acid transporter transmembrane domain-containing protein n=1 Tax=Erythroxylum novogranatense TaxID=1862640 RepID=A0AAV8TCK0_9ROSI|nr:hypothetical protein K2173_004895 [Erythroxylum novogranatense]